LLLTGGVDEKIKVWDLASFGTKVRGNVGMTHDQTSHAHVHNRVTKTTKSRSIRAIPIYTRKPTHLSCVCRISRSCDDMTGKCADNF